VQELRGEETHGLGHCGGVCDGWLLFAMVCSGFGK
jgi:hypothetical protein